MKKPFEVGERVRIFERYKVSAGKIMHLRNGEIPLLEVLVDHGGLDTERILVHPKQCRRLRPAKKRRRIFFERTVDGDGCSNVLEVWDKLQPGERVDFIELRRKKS